MLSKGKKVNNKRQRCFFNPLLRQLQASKFLIMVLAPNHLFREESSYMVSITNSNSFFFFFNHITKILQMFAYIDTLIPQFFSYLQSLDLYTQWSEIQCFSSSEFVFFFFCVNSSEFVLPVLKTTHFIF